MFYSLFQIQIICILLGVFLQYEYQLGRVRANMCFLQDTQNLQTASFKTAAHAMIQGNVTHLKKSTTSFLLHARSANVTVTDMRDKLCHIFNSSLGLPVTDGWGIFMISTCDL